MAKKQPRSGPKWHTVKMKDGRTARVAIVRKPQPKEPKNGNA